MIAMLTELLPNLVVAASIAGMAIYGWRQGLFLATVAGLQVLAPCLAALAFVPELQAFVSSWGIPSDQSFCVAFLLIFGLGILGIRLAVGAGVPHDAISFAPIIDMVGGGLVGAVAGLVVAGGLLIAWSMAGLPQGAELDARTLVIDAGKTMLSSFSRCVMPAGDGRKLLLEGERTSVDSAAAGRCSEPFVDANHNGAFDAGERYLDLDHNGSFTLERPFVDVNGNHCRDFGLCECYELASWQDLAVLYTPRITSRATASVKRTEDSDDELYQVTASDEEPGDMLTFHLKTDAEDDAADLVIDATSGRVGFIELPDPDLRKTYRFTVVVTDRHGLQAEQAIRVSIAPAGR